MAPEVGWAFGLAESEVDEARVVESGVRTGTAALTVLPAAVLLVTTADVLEVEGVDVELEELVAKDGGAIALEGSTSPPVPQETITPSPSLVEFVGVVT